MASKSPAHPPANGSSVSLVTRLHAALERDIETLVDRGRHRRLTTEEYLERHADVRQVSLLRRYGHIAWDPDDDDGGEEPLQVVDLGKLHDVKAVFTLSGDVSSAGRGLPKSDF